jgi:hypothetical protein
MGARAQQSAPAVGSLELEREREKERRKKDSRRLTLSASRTDCYDATSVYAVECGCAASRTIAVGVTSVDVAPHQPPGHEHRSESYYVH